MAAGEAFHRPAQKGDLPQLLVHKSRSKDQLYLLDYTRQDAVDLVYLGPHKNFYRDLKPRRVWHQAPATVFATFASNPNISTTRTHTLLDQLNAMLDRFSSKVSR